MAAPEVGEASLWLEGRRFDSRTALESLLPKAPTAPQALHCIIKVNCQKDGSRLRSDLIVLWFHISIKVTSSSSKMEAWTRWDLQPHTGSEECPSERGHTAGGLSVCVTHPHVGSWKRERKRRRNSLITTALCPRYLRLSTSASAWWYNQVAAVSGRQIQLRQYWEKRITAGIGRGGRTQVPA